jgi:phage terminase large subunit GpA-like protein
MQTSPPCFNYADARALVAGALDAFLPPQRISTADYAAANRYLFNEGGGYVGRWNHDVAPYLVEIMDALDDAEHTTVALAKPGQCGGTAIAENWFLKLACTDPANLLWYMQAQPALEAYVKRTINPMIAQHKELQRRLGPNRTDDSLKFKGFLGMAVELLPATFANLTNKAAGRIIADEYDGYTIGSTDGGYADPKALLDVRRSTFGRESKLFCLSHPDRAEGAKPEKWNAGIMSLYRDSDRRIWWWRCPHCEMWSSPNPGAAYVTTLEYNEKLPLDQIAFSAHLLCPHNGCLIADHERRGMNLTGRWVGLGQHIDPETGEITGQLARRDIAGFWIVGIMSPFLFGGIGGLAASLAKAQREFEDTGSDASLRQVVVKQVGCGYDPPKSVGSVDAATLVARADAQLALDTVANGVRFIVCAIDVQANRFELLFRGFGAGRESWIIRHQVIRDVLPATDGAAWDTMLREAAAAEFKLADGSGRVMRVLGVGYDSQGEAGVAVQGLEAWRRARKDNRARSMGLIAGRPAYRLLPLRGGSVSKNPRPLQVVRPDARADRRSGARGDVPVGLFAPNWFKDQAAAQLATGEIGPGYVHIPAALLSPAPPHSFFEQLVAERRDKRGNWEKVTARNEAWDLLVMTGTVAHLFAPSAFDWGRPPPWAREWDQNTLVGLPSAPQPSATGVPQAAPAQPPAAVKPPAQPPRETVPAARLSFTQKVAAAAASRAAQANAARRIGP